MDSITMEKMLERIEKLETELKAAKRGEDYRQIMNVIAGRSFCYNAHEQQYEMDRFWTKTKEDAYYNGNTDPVGVETYYVNNTRRLRAKQRDIVNRVYNLELTEEDKVGYRVMNMLTTPFIEIAGDGLTAQGVWMTFNVLCHVDENGIPQPTVNVGKMCAEFCKENGEWKIWRFRACPGGFDLNVNLINTGLVEGEEEEERRKMSFGMNYPPPEEAKLLHRREIKSYSHEHMRYSPWSPAVFDPPLPKPYETWEDATPFFEFLD